MNLFPGIGIRFLYDVAMFFLVLAWLPRLWLGKKSRQYRSSLKDRLGVRLPKLSRDGKPVIWIHGVSMGETKAATALFQELKKQYPHVAFAISATTDTGFAEAKLAMPSADVHFFFPLDFRCIMRRFVRYLRPSLLILVEGEFWYNLMKEVRAHGGQVALVNGKVSQRSTRRFALLPCFAKALFEQLDYCCVQTSGQRASFCKIGIPEEKIWVTGNLKFDLPPPTLNDQQIGEWRLKLGLHEGDFVVVLGSTHETEEDLLLDELQPLLSTCKRLKLIVVPRHPQRFIHVGKILDRRKISWFPLSQVESRSGDEQIVLIDTMGKLMNCYQIADIAVVCGSFIEGIGGHNLYEPAEFAVPIVFGPFVEQQTAYANALLEAKGAICIPFQEIGKTVGSLLADGKKRLEMGGAAHEVIMRARGSVCRTIHALSPVLNTL